jgi:hypothetical protein
VDGGGGGDHAGEREVGHRAQSALPGLGRGRRGDKGGVMTQGGNVPSLPVTRHQAGEG